MDVQPNAHPERQLININDFQSEQMFIAKGILLYTSVYPSIYEE